MLAAPANSAKWREIMAARILLILLTCCLSSIAMAQGLPPLGSGTQPPPPPSGLPPLGAPADAKPATAKAPSGGLSVDAANADLIQARAANQEKRYADAEAIMMRDTAARPTMPYLWPRAGAGSAGTEEVRRGGSQLQGGAEQRRDRAQAGSGAPGRFLHRRKRHHRACERELRRSASQRHR